MKNANSVVYFIEAAGHLKIGVSTNVSKRLAALQTSSAAPLSLMATIPGDRALELAIHRTLTPYRANGEWFKDCPEVRSLVADLRERGVQAVIDHYTPPRERAPDIQRMREPEPVPGLAAATNRLGRLLYHPIMRRVRCARSYERAAGLPAGSLMLKVMAEAPGGPKAHGQVIRLISDASKRIDRISDKLAIRVFKFLPEDALEAAGIAANALVDEVDAQVVVLLGPYDLDDVEAAYSAEDIGSLAALFRQKSSLEVTA